MVDYKIVPGFPAYRVGDDGSLWSQWKRIGGTVKGGRPINKFKMSGVWTKLALSADHYGYIQVDLRNGKKKRKTKLHVIVLESHVGPRPKGMVSCHRNHVKTDCRLTNLRWDTQANNVAESRDAGRYKWKRPLATHCKHGHKIDGIYKIDGKRYCKTCASARSMRSQARAKELLKNQEKRDEKHRTTQPATRIDQRSTGDGRLP